MLAVVVLAAAWVVAPTALSRDVLHELIGLVAVAGVVLGTVVRAPRSRVAWLLTAAGVLLLVGGDAMYSWYQDVLGVNPFPSPADAVYLSAYPVLAGALMVLVRSRGAGRDLVGILDAAVVTLSLGLVAWIVVGAPIVAEQGVTPSSLLSMAYPAADVMLLGVTARLTFGRGHRPLAYRLLVASIVLLTVADGAYTLLGSTAAASSRWLDATWLTSYVLAGAAALHPTMVDLSEPAIQERRITGRRLAGLTLAILVAPTAELLELLNGTGRNLWAVLIFSTALMAVVLSRLQLALHQAQRAVRQREQLHDRLVHQSAHDSLTKATSRAHFLDAIENRLRALDAAENPVGLLYLDLDHFKQVNDTFGHAVGDQVLQRVVDRIRHVVRADDLVGRVGGDEFVVLVHDANSEGLLVDIATRLLKAIERRMQVGEHSL